MISRKERELKERERFILEIAESLFLEKGIEETTMNLVSKEAQLSKTTLYKSFQSKEELELLVYKNIHLRKMDYIKSRINSISSPIKKLREFGKSYLSFFSDNPKTLLFQLKHDYKGIDRGKIRDEVIKIMDSSLSPDVVMLNRIFKDGQSCGEIRVELDSSKSLDLFYLTLRAVINQVIFYDKSRTFDSMFTDSEGKFDTFLDIFIEGIKRRSE